MAEENNARIVSAWNNNADLYEAVFAAHGLRYRREKRAFVALDPPPPYYSDLTLLRRHDTAEALAKVGELVARKSSGFSVKDGNSRLDVEALGLSVLFDASWVWAGADAISAAGNEWVRIDTSADLALWEDAWNRAGSPADRSVFVPDILKNPKVAIFGRHERSGFSAGCIANLSPDCVGISNLFGEPLPAVVADASAPVKDFGGSLPLVGYSTGDEFAAMLRVGFQQIGLLRVWIR
jgi:hypothetical protein